MKNISSVILIIFMTLFYGCNEDAPVSQLEFGKNVAGVNSAEAFRNTVHPVLMSKCASCHGDGGSNIKHAVSNYKDAHDVVVDGGKVDFTNPASSRLVDKLASQRHNCWDNDCNASAQEMLSAIQSWIELRASGPSVVAGAATGSLKYADATKRLPETINGSVVIQAEDGLLSGRMKTGVSSTASGFSYIAGDDPPPHPVEQTGRNDSVNGGCADVTTAQLSDTVNGRYRLNERRRHINQEGYRYYSQRVRFTLIRPDKRGLFNTEIVAGRVGLNNIRKFHLGFRAPDQDDILDNTVVTGNVRILPEFIDHATYLTNINSQNPAYANFFAPRFGATNIDYFLPNNEEVRAGLQSYLKNSLVYDTVRNRYRSIFYNNGNTSQGQTRFGRIPYVLRTMPDGMGGTINFVLDNLTISNQFFNYYFPLTRAAALSPVSGTDSTPLIDTYVHYLVDPQDRNFQNFAWSYSSVGGDPPYDVANGFTLNRGNTNLDLSALLAGNSSVDTRSIMTANYGNTLFQVVNANCAGCHGDGSGRPQFASPNPSIAFDAMIGLVNFTTPANSRPATRMDEGHNCGGNCAAIKNDIISAIGTWAASNTTAIEAAQGAAPTLRSLTAADRSPARATYAINITEAGSYNVWLKVMTSNNKRRFRVRVMDENRQIIDVCTTRNGDCVVQRTTNQNSHCEDWNTGTHPEWSWYTPSINDLDGRRQWNLPIGKYFVEIIEQDINAMIDMVAVSKNPEFNPAKNLIDEGLVTSGEPRYLKYDISGIIGSPGFFEIEIIEKNGGDSYEFRNPRFVGNTKNIKVKNIKLMINDKYEFNDSAYTKINAVVGTSKVNLTYAPLVALSISGLGFDSFKWVFEDLRTTTTNPTVIEDDAPVPVEGRECLNLPLFQNTVMNVLNRLRLVRKDEDGYTDYSTTTGDFPGNDRNGGQNAQFYTCTTCHTEEHPYFKMTTFFDQPEVLCAQALSRVDFGNFERSLLLRGINGTFNHPKLHFVESVDLSGSGNNRRFNTNSTKVNGFDSSWAGQRFEKYSAGTGPEQINLGAYSGTELAYLQKFIGQYKRTSPITINDPFAVQDGEIRLPGDSYNGASLEIDKWTYAASGRNLFQVISPEDFVANQGDLNPDNVTDGGLIRVKDSCLGVDFVTSNGVTTDPCNSNIDVKSEFEVIKSRYREAVINWMREEKRSYENR